MPATKYLPYGRQLISDNDIQAVVNVLKSDFLTQGPTVPLFEEALTNYVQSRFAVAVNSATSALHLACLSLGLGPGERLWTSPTSFVASANCARYCGADVDFVDIDSFTGLMSVEKLKTKLVQAETNGTLPKVVIPVHLSGSSCNMSEISRLSRQYGFYIIEDASHAIGGYYDEEPIGNCRYSDITVFSFHPVKIITSGEGGAALTNNPLLARRMAELRSHGITKDSSQFIDSHTELWHYEQQSLGFNYRMSDIQAALGLSQIGSLKRFVSERNDQLLHYQKLMNCLPVHILDIPDKAYSSCHLCITRLPKITPRDHSLVFNTMRAAGIAVQIHYIPIHLQPYYRDLGFRTGMYPSAEHHAKSVISIPLYPGLTLDDQARVVNALKESLKKTTLLD